jgi:hypothetical protein
MVRPATPRMERRRRPHDADEGAGAETPGGSCGGLLVEAEPVPGELDVLALELDAKPVAAQLACHQPDRARAEERIEYHARPGCEREPADRPNRAILPAGCRSPGLSTIAFTLRGACFSPSAAGERSRSTCWQQSA